MSDIRKNMRDLRRDFNFGTFDPSQAPADPFQLLKAWLQDAIDLKVKDANAFVLSTVNDGFPDSRVLLIRDISDQEIHFYTNYQSKKAMDIESNPQVSMNVFWPDLERQIRIHATLSKLSEQLSDDYFKTRPRASQIGAWASSQSQALASREELESRIAHYEQEFEGREVQRPPHWGGYAASPKYLEFWQGRPNRLHDRISYQKTDGAWQTGRLYP